jgi:hypothetical protein
MRSTCVDVSVGNICAARAVAVGTGDVMVSFIRRILDNVPGALTGDSDVDSHQA